MVAIVAMWCGVLVGVGGKDVCAGFDWKIRRRRGQVEMAKELRRVSGEISRGPGISLICDFYAKTVGTAETVSGEVVEPLAGRSGRAMTVLQHVVKAIEIRDNQSHAAGPWPQASHL